MDNSGYFTPINEVIILLITGFWAHLVGDSIKLWRIYVHLPPELPSFVSVLKGI